MRFAITILTVLLLSGCATSAAPRALPKLSEMTLDEKIGQLFVYAGHGVFMNEGSPVYQEMLRQVRDNHVGGMIWFVSDVYETALLTRKLQENAKIPLLISADLEAGMGMRFPSATFWPWPMALAATGDLSLAEKQARIVASEAKLLGINHIYAPVADVNNDPDNPVINARSFGEDPAKVGEFVAAFVRGTRAEGVLATAKHFPGHGDTHVDSHRSLPVLAVSRERLDKVELVPFRAAIAAGVDSVMIAHLSVTSLDATVAPVRPARPGENMYGAHATEIAENATMPATLSHPIVQKLLRERLGFNGLVITDALDMGGLTDHFDSAEAAVRAIEAGGDLLLKPENMNEAIAGVKAAVASGRISERRIDASVERILEAKSRVSYGVATFDEIFKGVAPPSNVAVAQEIASRAITLVRESTGTLPLRKEARVVEYVISDFPEITVPLTNFQFELSSRLITPPVRIVLDRRSSAEDVRKAISATEGADTIIFSLAIRARYGEGRIALPDGAREVIDAALKLPANKIGISFGSPYTIRAMPQLTTYLCAYGVQPVMQVAAARAIFGEEDITGRLPVQIPELHSIGEGIQKQAR